MSRQFEVLGIFGMRFLVEGGNGKTPLVFE